MLRTLTAIAAAIALSIPLLAADKPADLVVTNARIWTADPDQPDATALAVRNRSIILVTDDNDLARQLIGDDTTVIDAAGARLLPGLIDAHVHLVSAATQRTGLDLRQATSRKHLLQLLRDHAQTLEPDQWLIARGWSAESWPDPTPPTPDQIDQATSGRPALLTRMDGHSLIAGAAALKAADISRNTPKKNPPGGRIGRDKRGNPTGAVYEQAMSIFEEHLPFQTARRSRKLVREAATHANALGITQVGTIESLADLREIIAPLDKEDRLTLRINATVYEDHDTVSKWRRTIEWIARNRKLSPRVRIIGIKGYMDGSLGSRTAWMNEPYLDNNLDKHLESDNAGFPLALAANSRFRKIIELAIEHDLQPAVHAIGDKANHVALDWYADILPTHRRELRPRIEHAQHLLPEDVERFAELNVIPSMQPYHKADDGRYAEQRIGAERCKTSYAFRQLLDSGATLAFGSDWPVVSVSPWLGIHAAVTAQTLDGKTFVPEQSITVDEALHAYTTGAAYALHSETTTGMIRTHHRADFIILDRDVLTIDPEDIPNINVELTVLDGKVIHDAR